jgi:hypothetical protein
MRCVLGDFDFLIGSWKVANRRLKQRLVGSTDWEEFTAESVAWSLLDGAANIDQFTFPDGTSALTLRLYQPDREQWSLSWATSAEGSLFPPVVGAFSDGEGVFYGDDVQDGIPVRVRYIWSEITPASAHWEQAFSADQEQTWETNWIMELVRS